MKNKSLRYLKLIKSMGIDPIAEQDKLNIEKEKMTNLNRKVIDSKRIEALTGMEHPEQAKKRKMRLLLDSKIQKLEEDGGSDFLEMLDFLKQKRNKLEEY